MGLNKQKGNMYPFVTHTWNVIKGKCPHDCSYCYMKVFPQGELHFDEKELKTDLGENNFIFVGSSCDMFAEEVVFNFRVKLILQHCLKYPKNTYLFQTKNPKRFFDFKGEIDKLPHVILGTTIETDKNFNLKAPSIKERVGAMSKLNNRKFVTIEPIMEFNIFNMVDYLMEINPEFVNIGADSKGHNLTEPSLEKIMQLKEELENFTKVNLKENLGRLKNDR